MSWVKFVLNTKNVYEINYYLHIVQHFPHFKKYDSKSWTFSKTEEIRTKVVRFFFNKIFLAVL